MPPGVRRITGRSGQAGSVTSERFRWSSYVSMVFLTLHSAANYSRFFIVGLISLSTAYSRCKIRGGIVLSSRQPNFLITLIYVNINEFVLEILLKYSQGRVNIKSIHNQIIIIIIILDVPSLLMLNFVKLL